MKTTNLKSGFRNGIIYVLLTLLSLTSFAQNPGATFTAGPLMLRAKIYPTTSVLPNGKLISFGGREVNFISCSYSDMYDPVANTFTEAAMNYPHDAYAAVKLSSGKYFLMGGGADLGVAPGYSSTEMYDPVTNTFISKASMTMGRMQNAAAELSNGKVLVAGGWYSNATASSSEIYDTAANTFTASGNLKQPRSNAIIIPTNDGGAVLFGGWPTYGGSIYTSVEYYNPTTQAFTMQSTQLIPGDSGWVPYPIYTRPVSDCKLKNGSYVLFASRSYPTLQYGLLLFDPAAKTFSVFATATPIRDQYNDGGVIDIVINKTGNMVYVVGADSGYAPQRLSMVAVNMTTGAVFHPTGTFTMPTDEFFYPAMTYIPSNGKILVQGINSSNSSYFTGTKKTYLLTPTNSTGIATLEVTGGVLCYPNPASTAVRVEYAAPVNASYTVSLTDILGNTVIRNETWQNAGAINQELNTSFLPKGVYFLRVEGGYQLLTKTVFIR